MNNEKEERQKEVLSVLIMLKNLYRFTLLISLIALVVVICRHGLNKDFIGAAIQLGVINGGLYFLKSFAHNLYRPEIESYDE